MEKVGGFIEGFLGQCWASVADVGPTMNQRCAISRVCFIYLFGERDLDVKARYLGVRHFWLHMCCLHV